MNHGLLCYRLTSPGISTTNTLDYHLSGSQCASKDEATAALTNSRSPSQSAGQLTGARVSDGLGLCSCSLDVILGEAVWSAMCGSAPPLCLLLCMVGVMVTRTQGEVMAPASLSAVAGHPFTLGCNITMGTHDTLRQVRWLNMNSQVLVAYEPGVPVRITTRQRDVELTASHSDASSITVKSARPNDEGCYRCIFDIYPSGAQEGKTCLSVTVKVGLEGNKTAVSGKLATLSCWYNLPERVRQVLWRKTAEQGDTTSVASYAKHSHPTVEEPFRGRVSLSQSLGDTQLTIQPVQLEDEGCYTCEFHTYPEGTRSGTACLSVYVLPKPEVTYVTSSSGVTEANCTTQSRPAAEIMWSVVGDNRTLGPPISSSYDQGDGTTLVTSTLFLQSEKLNNLSVKCIVHHQGLEKPISVALSTNVGPALIVLISVCGVAAILLLCLCVCLCKCFICTGD